MPLTKLMTENLTRSIHDKAMELGFSDCGFSKAEPVDHTHKNFVEKWISKKKHGTMQWLERNKDKRYDPRLLSENAKTIITVSYNYFSTKKFYDNNSYIISKYAYGKDYHYVIKDKLGLLLSFIEEKTGKRKARIFVDSAPVLERYWAQKGGLGFTGKNTCLINRKNGSFFFIGSLILDLELNYTKADTANYCGTCTRCIDACPTQALKPFEIDANKCLSYITIEYRDETIPGYFKDKTANRIFGCDICQDVCPWNRFAKPHNEPLFEPEDELLKMTKQDWEKLDKPGFKRLFKHSAVKRAGYHRLMRNIKFNSGSK
jgi:epoxyqueuosine reductase